MSYRVSADHCLRPRLQHQPHQPASGDVQGIRCTAYFLGVENRKQTRCFTTELYVDDGTVVWLGPGR